MKKPAIRAMCHRDLRHVQEIASFCFPTPWNDNEFRMALYEHGYHAMVAEHMGGISAQDQILGYLIYRVHRWSLQIVNFAVAPKVQGRGVGTLLWSRVLHRLTLNRRPEVWADVDAGNLDAQLFLAGVGAKAFQIVPGEPEQYRFSFRLNGIRDFIGTCDTPIEEIAGTVPA